MQQLVIAKGELAPGITHSNYVFVYVCVYTTILVFLVAFLLT